MKLSLILQAVDRWSAPTKAATRATTELSNRGLCPLAIHGGAARRALDRVHGGAGRLPGAFARATAAARTFAGTRGLAMVEAASKRADVAIGGLARRTAGIATFGAGAAVAGGVGIMGMLTKGVFSTGMQFEDYGVRMQSAMGSVQAAQRAMAYIQKFAQDTPYGLSEVVEAFLAAKNQGIDPLNGSMMDLGDRAAAMGKTFEDSALAVGDAMRGQFERLLDFGVTASSKGSKVTFSYFDKAAKQLTRSVAKNKVAIRDAILSIFRETSGGGMFALSGTMGGIWRNLSDKWTGFLKKIADAGIYAKVKSRLQELLTWADRMNANGQFDAWAKRASNYMEDLFDRADRFVHDVDWNAVVSGVAGVTSAVIRLVEWIGKAERAWVKINGVGDWVDNKVGTDNGSRSLESRAWSILSWDPFDSWVSDQGAKPGKRPVPMRTPRALPSPHASAARASPAPKDGRVTVDIQLSGDAAPRANVRSLQSSRAVDASVQRGRGPRMAGPA